MNIEEYKNFLLSNIPTARPASGGKFVACRCFYCPDGKSKDTRHFYISIPAKSDEPSWYYCHKCHSSGIVSHRTLLEWNIFDSDIAVELTTHNNNCSRFKKNSKYYDQQKLNIKNKISESEMSYKKLEYINNRLGTSFTLKELEDLKICLNINDILSFNGIKEYTRDPRVIQSINEYFLGFLSIDNVFLNMRRLCDSGILHESVDKRYINYKIYDKFDTSNRFYTVPTEINLLYPEPVKLHIAEGPFDILSIYTNLRNRERGIYTCIAGSNYLGITFYFLNVFKLPYLELHYYPDNDEDGSNEVMKRTTNVFKRLGFPIYIHRNLMDGEKDFGVSPDRIREGIIQC